MDAITGPQAAHGAALPTGPLGATDSGGLAPFDLRRVRELAFLVSSHDGPDLIGAMFVGSTPLSVVASLATTCRFAHAALAVFPERPSDTADALAEHGMRPQPPVPSHIVRERLIQQHALRETDLDVQIIRVPIPAREGAERELEIFSVHCPDSAIRRRLADDEHAHQRQVHFALQVRPDRGGFHRLATRLATAGEFTPDGGGFNPHTGQSVLYFRAPGHITARRWPRRLELLLDRHEPEVLKRHLIVSSHMAAGR